MISLNPTVDPFLPRGAERVRGTAPVTGGSILFTGLTGDGWTGDGRERLSPLLSRDLQAPSGKHKEISPDGLVQTCQFYFAWFCFGFVFPFGSRRP